MVFSPTLTYLATRQLLDSSKIGGKPDAAGSGAASLADLQNIVGRQQLIIQALLMLLLEQKTIEKEELAKWVEYVDQLDGKADGKLGIDRSPVQCPSCGRTSPATAQRCIYCNAVLSEGILDRRAEQGLDKNKPPA